MKKILSILLTVSAFFLPTLPSYAQTSDFSVLKGFGKVASLEDYKSAQSFSGNFEIEDESDHLSVAYRLSSTSTVDNDEAPASFNRLNLYLKIFNHDEPDESWPLKEVVLNVAGEMTTIGMNDLYFKISSWNLNTVGQDASAIEDIKMANEIVNTLKNKWYHVNLEEFMEQELGEEFDSEVYLKFNETFKQDPRQAILDLVEIIAAEEGVSQSEEGMKQLTDGIDLLLSAKLFNERDVISGANKGFKFYSLNRTAVIELLKDFSSLLGEELSEVDEVVIRTFLGKTGLAGTYRVNQEHGMIDNFFARFRLRDIESLKDLEVNYRFKLLDFKQNNVINTPASFEPVQSLEESLAL